MVFNLVTGAEVVLAHSQIKSITQEQINPRTKAEKLYEFKEQGFYNETNLHILAVDSRTDDLPAIGVSTVFGMQHNRWIGTGLGVGVDHYALSTAEIVYSFFGEARGYFSEKNVSPFYVFRLGYGVPSRNDILLDKQGGLYIAPSLGYRIGSSRNVNFTLAVGYSFQRADYTYSGNIWQRETIEEQIQYKRLFVRLGLLF